jgi:hypothetical protein
MEEKLEQVIDPSKIKNLTNTEENSAILKAIEKAREVQKKPEPVATNKVSKFKFVESSIIDLPSGGKFYDQNDPELSKGKIKISPMTLREEEIMSTRRYIEDGTATLLALDNCIESNVKSEDLLLYDYPYLLFYLKKISYEDEHKFQVQCPYCLTDFEAGFKISELKFTEVPDFLKDPYKIDLPISKYSILLFLPRVKHLKEFEDVQKNIPFSEKDSFSGISKMFSIRTAAIITDKGQEVPKEDWEEFYSSLPTRDRHVLTEKSTFDNGLSKVMDNITCPNCSTVIGGGIPITDDLFRFSGE